MKPSLTLYAFGAALAVMGFAAPLQAQQSSVGQTSPQVADPHGWLGTETVKTKFGDFEFKNGYPTPATADALLDQLKLNRAIEVYLTQIPTVAIFAEHLGLADFGAKRPNQMVIWEQLMDAETLLLTPNTETVYALGHLDLIGIERLSFLYPDGLQVETLERREDFGRLIVDDMGQHLEERGSVGVDRVDGFAGAVEKLHLRRQRTQDQRRRLRRRLLRTRNARRPREELDQDRRR